MWGLAVDWGFGQGWEGDCSVGSTEAVWMGLCVARSGEKSMACLSQGRRLFVEHLPGVAALGVGRGLENLNWVEKAADFGLVEAVVVVGLESLAVAEVVVGLACFGV